MKARNAHAVLLISSYRFDFVPAGPRDSARPASMGISCRFTPYRGSLMAVSHLAFLPTVYKGRNPMPRTRFQQLPPRTFLLPLLDTQCRTLTYRPVLTDASTYTDQRTDNMHLPSQGYEKSQDLIPKPARVNGTASLAISEVCSLTRCCAASLSKITRKVVLRFQHNHTSHFTPTSFSRLKDSSRFSQCTHTVVTHEQQSSPGPIVSLLCPPHIRSFDDPKHLPMTA